MNSKQTKHIHGDQHRKEWRDGWRPDGQTLEVGGGRVTGWLAMAWKKPKPRVATSIQYIQILKTKTKLRAVADARRSGKWSASSLRGTDATQA
jgi:hypothetical protein